MAKNNKDVKEGGYSEIPLVLRESFKNAIFLLMERFENWDTVVHALYKYFETRKNTAISLNNVYQDAVNALDKTIVPPSIINSTSIPPNHVDEESIIKRAKTKFKLFNDAFKETFFHLGRPFNFHYDQAGGVVKNIDRLKQDAR